MKKRLISMLLTAGMLVSLVAGCGSKAETPGASGDSNAKQERKRHQQMGNIR